MKNYFELTTQEQEIFKLNQFDSTKNLTGITAHFIFEGKPIKSKINSVIDCIYDTYDILKSSIEYVDGVPYRKIGNKYKHSIIFKNNTSELKKHLNALSVEPINILDHLCRIDGIIIGDDKYGIIINMHHIIGDAYSIYLIGDIFKKLYDSQLNNEAIQEIKKESNFNNNIMQSLSYEKDKVYWLKKFAEYNPTYCVINSSNQLDANRITLSLGKQKSNRLFNFCKFNNVSIQQVFLAILNIYFCKTMNMEELNVALAINSRSLEEQKNIGMYVNTIVSRNNYYPEMPFIEYLSYIKKHNLIDLRHSKFNYNNLENELVKNNIFNGKPYDLYLSYQNEIINNGDAFWYFSKAQVESLSLTLYETKDGLIKIHYDYQLSKFNSKDIKILHSHLIELLCNAILNYECPISKINYIPNREKKLLLNNLNNNFYELNKKDHILYRFYEQVNSNPNNIAVRINNKFITYKELDNKANILASALLANGCKKGDYIGIISIKSIEMIISIIAVIKIGGIYIPIDPYYPQKRIEYIISDANIHLALVYGYNDKIANINQLSIDKLLCDECNIDIRSIENIERNFEDEIYAIYTSGTTGAPKGVVVSNHSLLNLMNSYKQIFDVSSGDNILQFASFCFDQSVGDIFSSLTYGATLVIVPNEIMYDFKNLEIYIKNNNITIMSLTPSVIRNLNPKEFSCLKVLDSGGESGDLEVLKEWSKYCKVYNIYGPTELTVNSTAKEITKKTKHLTIGKPICNTQAYVINNDELCGQNVIGELCLSGDSMSKGYLNRDNLNKDVFVDCPYNNNKMYKTGDLVKIDNNYDIVYIGRKDNQIKLHGYRIELNEIETAIKEIDFVQDAIAIVDSDDIGNKFICAYIVSSENIDVNSIKSILKKSLALYMIPSYIIQIDKMPINANGKIAKDSLPKFINNINNEYVQPVTKQQKYLCDLFSTILNREKVGIKDDFFSLGGHSLLAAKVINCINEKYNIEISFNDIMVNSTVEQLDEYLSNCKETKRKQVQILKVANQQRKYIMSPQELQIYLNSKNKNIGLAYNMPMCFEVSGDLNIEKLKTSLQTLINRHEILRTSFHVKNGEYIQEINKNVSVNFEYIKAKNFNLMAEIKNFVRPFDLSQASQFRAKVICISKHKHYFLLDFHHIICDGFSLNIIAKELSQIYNDENLSQNFFQYKDYSEWINSKDFNQQKRYWEDMLKTYESTSDLPIDFHRTKDQLYEGSEVSLSLSHKLVEQIIQTSKDTNTTQFMVFVSALMILISLYTMQDDIVVGSPMACRTNKNFEEIIGIFINTIVLRAHPSKEKSFKNFLNEIKNICLEAYENQEYPFSKLIDELNVSYDSSRNPLYDIMIIMQDEQYDINLNGLKMQRLNIASSTSKVDLTFNIVNKLNGVDVVLEYNSNLFSKNTAKNFVNYYILILDQVVSNNDIVIGELNICSKKDKKLITENFNNTFVEYDHNETIITLFENCVKQYSNQTALNYENQKITYNELNNNANRICYLLNQMKIGKGDFVIIYCDRSPEMIYALFGIIKSGATYVPIDPEYPIERINQILIDCKPNAIISFSERELSTNFNIPIINLKKIELSSVPNKQLNVKVDPDCVLYCLYTSGSSGVPKGVLVKHSNIVNYVIKNDKNVLNYAFNNNLTSIVSVTNITFDIFGTEIFSSILNGLEVFLCNKEEQINGLKLYQYICNNNIQILQTTPSRLQLILSSLNENDKINTLKLILVGGEKLTVSLANEIKKRSDAKLINVYGPTETTIWSSQYDVDIVNEYDIPIGKPINNTQIYILNNNKLSGIGIPGELCIAGDGVSNGYLNKDNLTEEKFVSNPFGNNILYKTGDLAKWNNDGTIMFIGRIDEQVKIRGYRIEIGEVTNSILNINGISETVVLVEKSNNAENYLVAYYVSENHIDSESIREELRNKIPQYMIPTFFIPISNIPLNNSGKVDKKRLPKASQISKSNYVKPKTHLEKQLCSIFSETLKVKQVGLYDDFYNLGGNSLKAAHISNLINHNIGVDISPENIMSISKINKICDLIENAQNHYSPINKCEFKDYYKVSPQQRQIFIVSQLTKNTTAYNIPLCIKTKSSIEVKKMESAFENLLNRHRILRSNYLLIDNSPYQYINNDENKEFVYLSSANEEDIATIFKTFVQPFNLESDKLLRMQIVETDEHNFYMMIDCHHIICDGLSLEILCNELFNLYLGRKLEEIKVDYLDYCEWLSLSEYNNQKEFWINEFNGQIPVLDFPLDFRRPQKQSYNGDQIIISLDKKIIEKINLFCKKTSCTKFMIFLSSLIILLSKYSGQEDIIVGSPISGRNHKDIEKAIGMFTKVLPFRGYPKKEKKFITLLEELKEYFFKAINNQDVPLEDVFKSLNIERDLSRNPLFDVMISYQEYSNNNSSGSDFEILPLTSGTSQFDMIFNIKEHNDSIDIIFEYCSDIFSKANAHYILKHYVNICSNAVSNEYQSINEISHLDKDEITLLEQFNNTNKKFQNDKLVIELFEEQVISNPDKVAIIYGNKKLTYFQLNNYANSVGKKLREVGVLPSDFVPIIAERSAEMIIAILGILKSGAAYVPIDPDFPEERIQYIINDCFAKVALVYKSNVKLDIPQIDLINIEEKVTANLSIVNNVSDPIYCIYTSGTTGKPKGVVVQNVGINNLTKALGNTYNINKNDNILQFATIAFDSSVWEIFMALLNGCTLCVASRKERYDVNSLRAFILKNKINIMLLPPQLLANFKNCPDMKLILSAGSVATPEIIKNVPKNTTYINEYGPTEGVVCSTYWKYDRNSLLPHNIPIGKPIDNKKIYIMNENSICGIGIPGELCVEGIGLAKEYLNNKKLTSEKFVINPYSSNMLYKTGDIARWLPDGNIEYIGRKDEQVKIRGYRVELGEIENAIRGIEGIEDVVVISREQNNFESIICAYYVSDELSNIISDEIIRQRLITILPNYMVPAYIQKIEYIPVTINGKIDKTKLPFNFENNKKDIIAPRNGFEELIANVVKKVLNYENISINDNFFSIGGDSISAIQLISLLEKEGIKLNVLDIIELQTIEAISKKVESFNKSKYEVHEEILDLNQYLSGMSLKNSSEYIELKENFPKLNNIESTKYPSLFQKEFFEKYKGIINAIKIRIEGDISENELKKATQQLILENEIFRAFYNNEKLHISSIDPVYKISYFKNKKSQLYYDKLAVTMAMNSENFFDKKPLSKIWIVEENTSLHYLYVIVHHGVWDLMCHEILCNKVSNILNGNTVMKPLYLNESNKIHEISFTDFYQFESDYQCAIKQFDNLISKYTYIGHREYTIVNKKHLDTFRKDPLMFSLNEYVKENFDEEIDFIPFAVYHHGRNKNNANTLGMFLELSPAIFDIKNKKIIYFDMSNQEKYQKIFYKYFNNYGQTMLPLINLRIVSKKSLVSDFNNNTGLNHIYNTYKQKGAITIDSDGNKIKIDIPNYKKN